MIFKNKYGSLSDTFNDLNQGNKPGDNEFVKARGGNREVKTSVNVF